MQSEQSDTCFWQNGRMNPKLQFDRRARRRAMPIVGCAFARYNLNVRFWQNEPNRFLLECPCLDVLTWQTQWHFAPAAAPSATRCERTAAADPAMGVGQYTYRALQVRFALTPHQPDQLLEQCAAKAMYVCDAAFFSNLKEFGRLRVERHSAKKMSEISIAQFKDFDVAADGRKVVLHFTDPDGRPIHFARDFALRRSRRRTPGPPFSSMNTTPAVSSALRMASSLAAVTRVHWAAGLDAWRARVLHFG
jgi:hypothetical protein